MQCACVVSAMSMIMVQILLHWLQSIAACTDAEKFMLRCLM